MLLALVSIFRLGVLVPLVLVSARLLVPLVEVEVDSTNAG
jgi:hypothetical protein